MCFFLRLCFFKKIQDWIPNPKMDFAFLCLTDQIMVCQRNQRIHFGQGFFGSFDLSDLGLFRKETQNLDLRIQSWIFLKKRTLRGTRILDIDMQCIKYG